VFQTHIEQFHKDTEDSLILYWVGSETKEEEDLDFLTQAGLASARARGNMGGRPNALDKKGKATAVRMYNSKKHSVVEICKLMGISHPTLLGYVK